MQRADRIERFYPYLLYIHDLVGARHGRILDDVLCEQAQADSAVLARVEGDGDARVEAVGDQVLRCRAVTVSRAAIVNLYRPRQSEQP